MPPNSSPEEPSAAMRTLARALRDMHAALVAEGFSEAQAIQMIGTTLAAQIQKPRD